MQGANGQGKSNLLEAIYHLCLGKSFRTLKESDMVYWEQPYFFLQGHVFFQKRLYKVENGYESEKGRKVVKINGRLLKKEEFVKFSPVVFFVPEDLDLIRRGPEERRDFFDREIGQLTIIIEIVCKDIKGLCDKKIGYEIKQAKQLTNFWRPGIVSWYFGSRILQQRAYSFHLG